MPQDDADTSLGNADYSKVKIIFEKLKEAIWKRRPILAEIMKKHGDDSLYNYVQDFLDVNISPLLDERRHELIEVAAELIKTRLGEEVAKGVAAQLTKFPLVSTADHHGPITHPFFLNSNIITAIPFIESADPVLKYLISFSFASISVNNSSYPRGIVFHGGDDGTKGFIKLPILPDRLKMSVVYGVPSYANEDIEKAKHQLQKKQNSGEVTPERAAKIADALTEHFGSKDIMEAANFASQTTKMNFNLWPAIFSESKKKEHIPDLIYIEIETIVRELLIKFHLNNPKSLLHRVLFDEKYQKLSLELFNNIPGGFSIENDWGSYMFWGLDEKFHRVRLVLKDGKLCSPSGEHVYELTPLSIANALKNGKIFPGMLLCYLVVSLYYGMKCLGGFSQVNDLTFLKNAWGKMLEQIGEKEELKAVLPVQTKELGGDGMVLAYLKDNEQKLVPATAIDMLIEKKEAGIKEYIELSRKITLMEAMSPLFPEIYNILYSIYQRDPDIAKISPEQILHALNIYKKMIV